MSDALLAASIFVRGANSTLNAAIRADGPTAARLAALHGGARSQHSGGAAANHSDANHSQANHSQADHSEASLCFVSTNPWSPDVDRLTLVLRADGVDLHLQDPVQARATVHADNGSLLALLRTPELLAADVDVQANESQSARYRIEGDARFARDVLKALHGLRPDLLLPLSELVGSGLPSALHTLRTAAGGMLRGVLDALRPGVPPQAPSPPPPPPPPADAARAAPVDTRLDDPNGAR